jgi:hypothetical protein
MERTLVGLLLVGAIAAGGATALAAPAAEPEGAAPGKATVGEVSVAGAAFTDDTGDEDCRVARGAYAYIAADPEAVDEDCDLVAGIQLPDEAQLLALRCSLYDSYAANVFEAYLIRVELATGAPQIVFRTAGTVDSGIVQLVGDGTPEPATARVDNAKFAYYLAAAFSYSDFTTAGNEMRVYGCTVAYR